MDRRLAAIRTLFPPEAVVEGAVPGTVEVVLYPEEEATVRLAIARRRDQFAAARWCARSVFQQLGLPPQPLPNDARRAPVWPEGVVGSVSHTAEYCAVVGARRSDLRSVGLDIERDEPVGERLWDRICTGAELEWLERRSQEERGRWVRLIFSAKECFYKCQYGVTQTFLGFHDATLRIDLRAGRFEVELRRASGVFAAGSSFGGRWVREGGLLATGMCLPRASGHEAECPDERR